LRNPGSAAVGTNKRANTLPDLDADRLDRLERRVIALEHRLALLLGAGAVVAPQLPGECPAPE
jgi:hypothetical protein